MANPGINVALMVAAQQQAMAATQVTDPLRKAGAFTPRTATKLGLSAKGADKLLAGLVKRGHVRSTGDGRYWLDEAAIARTKAAGTRVALILIVFLLSVTASLLALALR